MTRVTFYHSMICPRCFMASRAIESLRDDFPHIEVEPVEFLANLSAAKEAGVRAIPTLVAGDAVLSGFYLTKGRIRTFFESLA